MILTKTDLGFRTYGTPLMNQWTKSMGKRKRTNMELEAKLFCTSNQGYLVRAASLINHLLTLDLRNDSMTNSQKSKEFNKRLPLPRLLIYTADVDVSTK